MSELAKWGLTLHRWEIGVATLGVLFALIYLLSNTWGVGLAALCADALWVLTRVDIGERPGAPGRYATLRGRLGLVRLACLLGVYVFFFYGLRIVREDHATKGARCLHGKIWVMGHAQLVPWLERQHKTRRS
jgi:hypothetical protein